MTEVGRVIHQLSWSFVQIARSIGDRLRLGTTTTGSVWGDVPLHQPAQAQRVEDGERYDFVCNEEKYSEHERRKIVEHCERPFKASQTRREPSELEWLIMTGMLEGDIVAKNLPQFLRRVSTGESLWRFQPTIQAQVDGHMFGRLTDNTPVYSSQRSTKRLVESITLAARQRNDQNDVLYAMLKTIRRIEYHEGSHSLNFYFYTRDEAAKWAGTEVPFRRQKLALVDIHAPSVTERNEAPRDVWQRQRGHDGGVDVDMRFRYKGQLLNITTFMGVAAFLTALKAKIGEAFLAYSIDRGGPTSDHSHHWQLEFETSECPKELVDVHRIYWADHKVLVHHVNTHKQPPCLTCGSSQLFARSCKTALDDLRTENCIVFDRDEVSKQAAVKATF